MKEWRYLFAQFPMFADADSFVHSSKDVSHSGSVFVPQPFCNAVTVHVNIQISSRLITDAAQYVPHQHWMYRLPYGVSYTWDIIFKNFVWADVTNGLREKKAQSKGKEDFIKQDISA